MKVYLKEEHKFLYRNVSKLIYLTILNLTKRTYVYFRLEVVINNKFKK